MGHSKMRKKYVRPLQNRANIYSQCMPARYWPPKNIFPFALTKSVFWWSSLVVRSPPKLDATTPGSKLCQTLSSCVTWSFSCETLFWLNFWIQCESIVFTILPRLWPVLIVAGAEKASPAWVTFYHENFYWFKSNIALHFLQVQNINSDQGQLVWVLELRLALDLNLKPLILTFQINWLTFLSMFLITHELHSWNCDNLDSCKTAKNRL